MPPKSAIAKVASNVTEVAREPVREVKKQVYTGLTQDLAQMLYGGPGVAKTDEEIKQIKKQDRMMKNEVYSRGLQELGLIRGKNLEEITITPEQREEIERLHASYSGFEQQQRETAKNLGVASPNVGEQERQQRKQTEAQEKARKEAERKSRLEMQIEAPPGKVTGLSFKRKRSTPRMKLPPKSAETRASRGIGG